MTDELQLKLLEELIATDDREESIKIARQLFPDMPMKELIATVDESLKGYQPKSPAGKSRRETIS